MATMEKPKQKKKKKVLTSRNETLLLDGVDIDFPSTSTSEQIPSEECFIASQYMENSIETDIATNDDEIQLLEGDNCKSAETSEIQDIKQHQTDFIATEINKSPVYCKTNVESTAAVKEKLLFDTSPIIPSAPLGQYDEHVVAKHISMVYPNLEQMKINENQSMSFNVIKASKENIMLKPFTEHQLKELYNNPLLEITQLFETEFNTNELSTNYKDHILFELLMKYSKSRYNLKINLIDLQSSKKSYQINSDQIWKIEKRIKQYNAVCRDGFSTAESELYEFAHLDERTFDNVSSSLTDLLNLICFNYTHNLYTSSVNKIQIDQQIGELLSRPEFLRIKKDAPVVLQREIEPSLLEPIRQIRIAISILFNFLRRPMPDKVFSNELKMWLQQLVAVYLRMATWQDHMFLLFHVLRCPAGVSSWARSIIQIPKPPTQENISPFTSDESHYCVTFLKVLLLPIKTRDEFLAQLQEDNKPIDATKEDLWILVDSDGEEEHTSNSLRENDMVVLLNQIPLERLFGSMTFAEYEETWNLNHELVTGQHLLKFISFATNFIQLLGKGLGTYDTERYKQFAKMICRLVRHTVLYVSDMHEIFKNNSTPKDVYLCSRIQIEYDSFVLRASHNIYQSRYLGTWQYLAILPFADLYIENIWKLYYSLTVGFTENVIENVEDDFKQKTLASPFLNQFNDTIIDIQAEDMYYLLQTFSSMALSRETVDWDFIERVTLDLFKIGFINTATKENCYKITRDLLENITIKYPKLISSILTLLKENFQLTENGGIYLFKSLPLQTWHPTMTDFEIASGWLLNFSFDTPESTIARTIFSRLNWNFDRNNELFLPHDIHIRTACLIAQVASKHVPETIGSSSISESVRQVSNLVKSQSTKQQFTTWCWNMISVLRLHCLDQNRDFIIQTLRSPIDAFKFIPELEKLQYIFEGVSDSRPIALYLSVLSSLCGHSVPQICHNGFSQMQLMITDYRHSTVIRCLYLIAPLFLECPESISKCHKFQSILTQLLSADRTYLRIAKDLLTSEYIGPVVELLTNMIQAQIIEYYNYGMTSPTPFINLWLQCLTTNPFWNKYFFAIHIIDIILSIAYQFSEAWFSAKEFFRFLYTKTDEGKSTKNSFLPFLGGSQQNSQFAIPSPNSVWLSLLTLELEHDLLENRTKLWPELLRQLQSTTGKFSMDNLIKKSATLVSCTACSTNSLVLYKLANLIITVPLGHHLLPILCQRFFNLYLARIPMSTDESHFAEIFGVADKFYETNIPLMKKLKKCLCEVENYYKEKSVKEKDVDLSQFYNNCTRIFRGYSLWLEETRLNKILNLQVEFPPQYELNKLALIFAKNDSNWNEYVHFPSIREMQKTAANIWLKSCFRYVTPEKCLLVPMKIDKKVDPKVHIIRHLQSYDSPASPPDISIKPPVIKNFSHEDLYKNVLPMLRNDFKKLDDSARQFNITLKELNSLDCSFKELVRILYKNEMYKCKRAVQCSSSHLKNKCHGDIRAEFMISKPIINDNIQIQMRNNRERHEKLISKQISLPPDSTVMAIVEIQHSVRRILEMHQLFKQNGDEKWSTIVTNVGITYFYETINSLNEFLNGFPPANELCAQMLSNLGILIRENQSTQGMNLLVLALRRPNMVKLISDLFVPSVTAPAIFLDMYKFIVNSYMKKCDTKILFVLLSKFDISYWLVQFKPKLVDITKLIQLTVQGLECWNQNDAALIQGVLRRQLIHIFEYDFPEHYGEVLQVVIVGCSEQKLVPSVLMELINSIYKLAKCNELESQMQPSKARDEIIHFSTTQKLFTFEEIQATMALLARHYQSERLQYGLHGLYPKHKDYCDTILLLFKTFSCSVTVAAVYAYPGLLADKLVDWLWPNLSDLFSPWLVPYYPQNMQNHPANWIKQVLANNQILQPWSELHLESAQKFLHAFVDSIQFFLSSLPASDAILGNIFYWYEINFCNLAAPKHILTPVHAALTLLPWNQFRPTPVHITCFYRILQQFLPECHSFAGHIFLRIPWTLWIQQNIPILDYSTRAKVLSYILLIYVKFSYEPHVRENMHFAALIQEASNYPWHLVDFQGMEGVFEWFVMSVEPSIILKLTSEHGAVDNGVLNLLQIVSAMNTQNYPIVSQSQLQSKRILYVKSMVRMLRLCGSKHQQLLSTKEGLTSFHCAVVDLINMIETIIINNERNYETEAINLMFEIVGSLQAQSEFTSRIFVEAIIIWQSKSQIGNVVLFSILNAIGMCKMLSINTLALLESTIYNYFRTLESSREHHNTSWQNIIQRLGPSLPKIETIDLVRGNYLLSLHLHAIYKLQECDNVGDKITFLQNMHRLLENYKTNETTEPKLAIIWGVIISSGYQFFKVNSSSKNQLLTLGRFLQTISSQSDGWGEGLLGAIGLKKDSVSKKRRILTRCLSCIIFSLFPDTSQSDQQPCKEYQLAIEELTNAINSKKYSEIRATAFLAMEALESQQQDCSKTKENICKVIRLFYKESFLKTLEDVWMF